MDQSTHYSESTTCSECDKRLTFDEDGFWCDEEDHSVCSATPVWKNTRLIGWDMKSHSPVVEVK